MNRFKQNAIIALKGDPPRYDLAQSVGPELSLDDILTSTDWDAFKNLRLSYTSLSGSRRLRELIATQNGADSDDVVVTVGAMQTLFLVSFITSANKGEVITTRPVFPLTKTILDAIDAEVKFVPLSFSDGYYLSPEKVIEQMTGSTCLVCLTTPQNPSGVSISQEDIKEIVTGLERICPDAILLLDTIYSDAIAAHGELPKSLHSLSPRIVTCTSLSKAYGAPGLRLGWAITTNSALREQLTLGKFNTSNSTSTVDEFLALKLLEQRDAVLADRQELLSRRLKIVSEWVANNSNFVEWISPDGGAICALRLHPAIFSETDAQRVFDLAYSEGVMIALGKWFDDDPNVCRLGFAYLSEDDLRTGLSIFEKQLQLVGTKNEGSVAKS